MLRFSLKDYVLNLSGPIIGTIAGILVVSSYDIPPNVFFPNIAAIIIGILLAVIILPKFREFKLRQIQALSIISIFLLASTFIFSGQLNVHRWISLLSLNINVSMIILPLLIFCINYLLIKNKFLYTLVVFGITGVILTFQPDAGEATSFVIAVVALAILNKAKFQTILAVLIIGLSILYKVWLRVDLLEPVEYVEEILYMFTSFGLVGYLAILLSAICIFYPFINRSFKNDKSLSIAFSLYLISTYVVTEFGHYPVPILGAGASPIIGWYLMVGLMNKIDLISNE